MKTKPLLHARVLAVGLINTVAQFVCAVSYPVALEKFTFWVNVYSPLPRGNQDATGAALVDDPVAEQPGVNCCVTLTHAKHVE